MPSFSEKQCQHRRDGEAWFLRNMIRCGDARREINCYRLQTLTVAINPSLAELRKLPAPPDLVYPSYLRTRQSKSRWVVSVQSHETLEAQRQPSLSELPEPDVLDVHCPKKKRPPFSILMPKLGCLKRSLGFASRRACMKIDLSSVRR